MFSTLKKLGHRRKCPRKGGKDKKNREVLSQSDKLKSTARSSFDLCSDPLSTFDPSRRHSCFSAFIDVPTELLRRGSNASSQGSTLSGGSKCRRGSSASTASTSSAESCHVRRLAEIAQIDRYVENLKKSADSDNLSYIPNRLCVALLLKSVLQRRERQYMYEYLHSNNRCLSESDVSMKSQRDEELTLSDFNNNNKNNKNNNNSSSINNNNDDNGNNNNDDDNTGVDKSNLTASDEKESRLRRLKKDSPYVESESDDSCHDLHSNDIDTSDDGEYSIDPKEKVSKVEPRVPGALLKAYQLEHSGRSSDSDYEMKESKHCRCKKRSESKKRRKSIALFPQNYEIY